MAIRHRGGESPWEYDEESAGHNLGDGELTTRNGHYLNAFHNGTSFAHHVVTGPSPEDPLHVNDGFQSMAHAKRAAEHLSDRIANG